MSQEPVEDPIEQIAYSKIYLEKFEEKFRRGIAKRDEKLARDGIIIKKEEPISKTEEEKKEIDENIKSTLNLVGEPNARFTACRMLPRDMR